MDNRKWEADAIVSPPTAPASPSDGYPTNGDPGAAQNATEPGAWWFHAVGEELRAVILEGGLTPDLSTLTQLRDAIKNIAKGGDYKESVRIASTANVASISGLLTIDGITVVAGDRALLKDQTTASQNGIYVAAAGAWSRATDADTGAEFNGGAIIPVEEGTLNADTNWQLKNNGTVTIGTTALTFVNLEPRHATLLAGNGYRVFPAYPGDPTPLIVQWGVSSSIVAGSSATVTFPIAFSNLVLSASANPGVTSNTATPTGGGLQFGSLTTMTIRNMGTTNNYTFQWVAIGY